MARGSAQPGIRSTQARTLAAISVIDCSKLTPATALRGLRSWSPSSIHSISIWGDSE